MPWPPQPNGRLPPNEKALRGPSACKTTNAGWKICLARGGREIDVCRFVSEFVGRRTGSSIRFGGDQRNHETGLPMLDKARVIHSDPDILGGKLVFVGTRVPVNTLVDYLEAGDRLDEFLDHFPSVSREQAIAALELAKEMLASHAHTP
jgi:uncharacterized protein (DUF433 family)